MYNQHFLLTNSIPGREDEFDQWYEWVHIRDVMRGSASAVAAQCFRRVEIEGAPGGTARYGHRFLCLYENSDPEVMTGKHGPKGDPDMLMSSAADHNMGMGGGYYDTVIQRTKAPGRWPDADLIIEWIEPAAATPEAIDWYVARRFPALMSNSDLVSGWLGKASDHQIHNARRPAYVATYRTTRLGNAARDWQVPDAAGRAPWAEDDRWLMYFRQVSPRVTRLQMLEPDPASREAEQATRAAVRARWEAVAS